MCPSFPLFNFFPPLALWYLFSSRYLDFFPSSCFCFSQQGSYFTDSAPSGNWEACSTMLSLSHSHSLSLSLAPTLPVSLTLSLSFLTCHPSLKVSLFLSNNFQAAKLLPFIPCALYTLFSLWYFFFFPSFSLYFLDQYTSNKHMWALCP